MSDKTSDVVHEFTLNGTNYVVFKDKVDKSQANPGYYYTLFLLYSLTFKRNNVNLLICWQLYYLLTIFSLFLYSKLVQLYIFLVDDDVEDSETTFNQREFKHFHGK